MWKITVYRHSRWQAVVGEAVEIHLCCQAPGQWHTVNNGGKYVLSKPAAWILTMSPYVKKLLPVLKIVAAAAGLPQAKSHSAVDDWQDYFQFMSAVVENVPKTLVKDVSEDEKHGSLSLGSTWEEDDSARPYLDSLGRSTIASGAELRVLRVLLERLDPERRWGGLERVVTPEAEFLWVCPEHSLQLKTTYGGRTGSSSS
jgi:hypothetical protein